MRLFKVLRIRRKSGSQLLSFVLVSAIFQSIGWAAAFTGFRDGYQSTRDNGKTDSEVTIYVEQLKDSDERIRANGALQLGEVDLSSRQRLKKEALPLLVSLLKDDDTAVRANAALALKNLPSESQAIVPALIDALQDPDPEVRAEVLSALANVSRTLDAPEIVQSLTQASEDPDSDVRANMFNAIAQRGGSSPEQLISIQINAFEDENVNVRVAAIRTFHKIVHYDESNTRRILYALVDVLESKEEMVRQSASSTLASAINSLSGDDGTYFEDSEALPVARSFIPTLTKVLKNNSDPKVRENIALAFANMGGQEAKFAVPTLINLVKTSQDPKVAGRSIYALRRIDLDNPEVISTLIDALKVDTGVYAYAGNNTPQDAAYALGELAESFVDKQTELSNKELSQAISTLEASLESLNDRSDFFSSETIARVSRSLSSLQLERRLRWSSTIASLFKSYPWVICFPLAATSYIAILWLRPRWLLLIPSELSIPKTGLRFPVSILRWLKYRPRVLDAWVSEHISLARKNFLALDTVKQRQIHIPLQELHGRSYFDFVCSVFSNKEFCLLIHGLGGTGKTSLACQIAQWSMEKNQKKRLCSYPMIAVLVEQNFDQEVEKTKQLVSAIKGRLERLIMSTDTISDELLDQLLRHRRLLVIIDHLSELNTETKQAIKPSSPDFPVKALVVTSRVEESLDRVQKHEIAIPKLSSSAGQLTTFLESYLNSRNKALLFKSHSAQIEFNTYCNQLIRIAGSRGITVLLAKLYAELMISQKEGTSIEALPTSVPDVMLSYINELNAEYRIDSFDNYVIQKDAAAIAWACVKSTYYPTFIKREVVSNVLSGENADERISHLETRLQLIQTTGLDQGYVRFVLDPLAEYLAALHMIELNRDSLQAWQAFFEKAKKFEIDEITGFLCAVSDCCQRHREQLPDTVIEDLAELIEPRETVRQDIQ